MTPTPLPWRTLTSQMSGLRGPPLLMTEDIHSWKRIKKQAADGEDIPKFNGKEDESPSRENWELMKMIMTMLVN